MAFKFTNRNPLACYHPHNEKAANSHNKISIVVDADLQDPPQVIYEMYRLWRENNIKIVYAKRKDRSKESFIKSKLSESFYTLSNLFGQVFYKFYCLYLSNLSLPIKVEFV